MNEPIRWGIIGTGKIASKFATALNSLPDAELVAVGSRSETKAAEFAAAFGVQQPYGSYEAVAEDRAVDVVYVATPHVLHAVNTRLCIEAGKAVLCEKPFALNALEAAGVVALARERGVFLMEAMWMRFIPLFSRLRELLQEGAVGDVRMLSADFGYRADFGPEHRLRNPDLGGGALLDVGIYPINLASMIFGAPRHMATRAHTGATGIDEQNAVILQYGRGELAVLYSAIDVHTPVEAVIIGTEGSIRLHRRFHHPVKLSIIREGAVERAVEMPYEGNGLQFEAIEVMHGLRSGWKESPVMPLDETVSILGTMDAIRREWGLAYPGERPPAAPHP